MINVDRGALWSAAHVERAALATDLAGLDETQWAQRDRFRRVIPSTTSAPGRRRPLGLARTPSVAAATRGARLYTRGDFTGDQPQQRQRLTSRSDRRPLR